MSILPRQTPRQRAVCVLIAEEREDASFEVEHERVHAVRACPQPQSRPRNYGYVSSPIWKRSMDSNATRRRVARAPPRTLSIVPSTRAQTPVSPILNHLTKNPHSIRLWMRWSALVADVETQGAWVTVSENSRPTDSTYPHPQDRFAFRSLLTTRSFFKSDSDDREFKRL